ncbi:hypothetical protein [Streptomyces vinaceus]|uniref:hypothetical protein n=1 Tax=Streptomyces vinaceus TaxID=1960 RepID=UPI0036BFC96B
MEIRLVLDFTALPAIGDGRAERAFKTYCWDYRQACEPAWAPPAPEREDFLALSLLDAEGEVCAVLGVNRTGLQTVFRAFQRACVAHARYLDAAYPFEV